MPKVLTSESGSAVSNVTSSFIFVSKGQLILLAPTATNIFDASCFSISDGANKTLTGLIVKDPLFKNEFEWSYWFEEDVGDEDNDNGTLNMKGELDKGPKVIEASSEETGKGSECEPIEIRALS